MNKRRFTLRIFSILAPFVALSIATTADASTNPFLDSFLASAWQDHKVQLQTENQKVFSNSSSSYRLDGIQLRPTQNDEEADRKAGVRVSLKGVSEFRIARDLHKQGMRIEDLEVKNQLVKALAERYTATVEYSYLIEKSRLLSELAEVQERKLAMQKAALRSSAADGRDVVRAKTDLEETRLKLGVVDSRLAGIQMRMKSLDPRFKGSAITLTQLPQPSDLPSMLEKLSGQFPSGQSDVVSAPSTEARLARERAQQERRSYDLDVARKGRLVDFVEVSVSADRKGEKYGVQVGFNLPGFAESDASMRDKSRQLVRYEIEAREAERLQSETMVSRRRAIERAASFYKALNGTADAAVEERVKRVARKHDPLLVLTMDESHLERGIQKVDAAQEGLLAYVEYLTASDLLSEKPETNYLSRELRNIPAHVKVGGSR